MKEIKKIKNLLSKWQDDLGEEVQVVLGGSLVSGLFILDQETKVIDVDVRFLVENPEDEKIRKKIETLTGLNYKKTITVSDWPSGESKAFMVERQIRLLGVSTPLDIEGCIRNQKYVGWGKFYQEVLSPDEIKDFLQRKLELRHNKAEYKNLKNLTLKKVIERCLERGLVKI